MRIKDHIEKLSLETVTTLAFKWQKLHSEVSDELDKLKAAGLSDPTRLDELEVIKARAESMDEGFQKLLAALKLSDSTTAAERNRMKRYADKAEDHFADHLETFEGY